MITRRRFIRTMGSVCLLYLSSDLSRGLIFAPEPEASSETGRKSHEISAAFLGTGVMGVRIATHLRSRSVSSTNTGNDLGIYHLTDFMSNSRKLSLDSYPIIFFAGKIDDPDFWVGRELAISANPSLLVTIVDNAAIFGTVPTIPLQNESWVYVTENDLSIPKRRDH